MEILFDFGVGAYVPKRDGSRCFGKEDRFQVPSFQGRWRVGSLVLNGRRAGSLVLASALILLGLAVPDACAQPFTERNPAQDFNTLGLVGDNKNPVGLCAVKHPTNGKTYMLVSDSRDGKIYTYDMEEGKERQDNHRGIAANNDDFDLAEVNLLPTGIWASGTNLWVADGKVYGDKTSGREFDPDEDTNKYAKVFAYTLKWERREETEGEGENAQTSVYYIVRKHERQRSKEFWLYHNGVNKESNISPTGLWSDGKTMWVANSGVDRIFAYNMWTSTTNSMGAVTRNFDGSHAADRGFDLGEENTYAQGIWSDGETMWVSDFAGKDADDEKKIFAYNLGTGNPDSSKDYNTLKGAGNERPRGIWSDGETMWVADKIDNKIYAYHGFLSPTTRNDKQDFKTPLKAAGNNAPRGIWSDGETMWVADDGDDKLYAYNLATKDRDLAKEITASNTDVLLSVDLFKSYIWSDGETMWVSSFNRNHSSESPTDWTAAATNRGDDTAGIYAFKLSDGSRDVSKDFGHLINTNLTYRGNDRPRGIWSDGETLWVAERDDYSGTERTNKIYAYDLATKARDPNQDFPRKTLHEAGNRAPAGLWSDGETMWVGDDDDNKLYAYNLATKTRDSDKDFDTLQAAGNHKPRGIWSDGATMWVVDEEDDKIYAYRLSNAASLGSLKLTGHIPPGNHEYKDFEVHLKPAPFDSGTTRYTASVPYATSYLTVTPETLRTSEGGFSYSPAEDAATTDGHQVNLSVGNNRIAVTVTNRQATSLPRTRTYTVDVNREFFTYNDPSKDILISDNPTINPTIHGIWANESTIWAVDFRSVYEVIENGQTTQHKKILAYNRETKQHIESQDFNLDPDNLQPRGLWSDGATMWVSDSTDAKLYAYKMPDKARDEAKDFNGLSRPGEDGEQTPLIPYGIWSDDTTMWVADDGSGTIYVYDVGSKNRKTNEDGEKFDQKLQVLLSEAGNTKPTAIWSDGETIWVANSDANNAKIYAYKLTGDCREEGKDFNTLKAVGNHHPSGLWSDGTNMWVADSQDGKIYAYNQPHSGNASLKRLELSNVYYGNELFSGRFERGRTEYPNAYVLHSTTFTTVAAVPEDLDAITAEISPPDASSILSGHQVNLNFGNSNPISITITAENGVTKQYTVNIRRRYNDGRLPFRDFNFLTKHANDNPTGLWSDGTNMWVLDGTDKRFYVYKMAENEWGKLDSDKGFGLDASTSTPIDIWSNGEIMWVTDAGRDKIYAYDLNASANHYHSSEDFNTLSSSRNTSPRGLWSDGATMWVVDDSYKATVGNDLVQKIFAYNLNLGETNKTRVDDKEFTLSVDNVSPWGIWSNSTNMWVLDRDDNKLYAYEMLGENRGDPDPSKDITLLKDIALNGEGESVRSYLGNPRGIWSDGATMWVSVLDDKKIYAYDMNAEVSGNLDVSNDSTLIVLKLSGIGLNPAFSPDKEIYTALVDHTVASTTVTATPNASEATVKIFSGTHGTTRSTADKGPQVSLQEGYNIIAIDVTAENGISRSTYLIDVTKSEAPPTSGGPLPVFRSASAGDNPTADLSSSSIAGIGEGESRLIFAETLPDGGVRFVFAVPAAEEFGIEETPDLLGETWRPLPDAEAQILREKTVDGQDRLTLILPKTEEKQRFLRLTPLK